MRGDKLVVWSDTATFLPVEADKGYEVLKHFYLGGLSALFIFVRRANINVARPFTAVRDEGLQKAKTQPPLT